MDLKPGKWKLNFRGGKDKWLVVLAVGLIFLILAFPAGSKGTGGGAAWNQGEQEGGQDGQGQAEGDQGTGEESLWGQTLWSQTADNSSGQVQSRWNLTGAEAGQMSGNEPGAEDSSQDGLADGNQDTQEISAKPAGTKGTLTYEQQLEERLKELLSHVEGVGQVEVMIVLKSSEEKIWRVDRNTSYSSTQETDSNGGTRNIRSQETTEGTILSGQSGGEGPLLEKEMRPEISGVVVSADGGGSPTVQAEISAAVEALFDVPSHKIKVLKRAE